METYNYNDKNKSKNYSHLKLVCFSINNKSNHFEQIIKTIIMIKNVFNNAKIDNILFIPFRLRIVYNLKKKVRKAKRK